ncbi:30S ribosomal protein S18 [Columbia Basin potato purple top phytoplasma]|uniref:30S ribosomal protein S18 n=2 Tax=Columbia Basin potato purple top phytoplasma TaxID=307134 RepID=A0ABT5LAI9_9MOLU|nr:30S ribosomal protein S18 [Columbia Basin potato purple top phytoplasma]
MNKRKKFYKKRPKVCFFTENKFTRIDFKDVNLLSRFITDRGKILPSRFNKISVKWQKRLSKAIKLARIMALIK